MKVIQFIYWFIAGALAAILGHQIMLGLLHWINLTDRYPFAFTPTKPFGVPALISLCFWAGLWAIIYGYLENTLVGFFKSRWLSAIIFGIFPITVVNLFIVLPLKGQPFAAGWKINAILTSIFVNIAWALVVSLFLWKKPFNSQSS